MLHHDFRRFLDALGKLNPAQIEDAQTKILDLRRKSEAISEIEARTNQETSLSRLRPSTAPHSAHVCQVWWGATKIRSPRHSSGL